MKSPELSSLNDITSEILDSAIEVHREMGPGLLESVYQNCMIIELEERGLDVAPQTPVPLHYKGTQLEKNYLIDLLVEDEIIVELKAVEMVLPVHEAQILSYLKLTNKRIGILINFNVKLLKNGFKRFINGY